MTTSSHINVGSHLFCTAAPGLSTGTILTPEFGRRVLDLVVYNENGLHAPGAISSLLDLTWEVVRMQEFPERPSRFQCLFLWQEESRARDFASRRPHPAELYEVEVVTCSRMVIADMDLISYFERPETVASMMERARRYWRAEDVRGGPEVLLEGTAQVIRLLDSDVGGGSLRAQ